MLVPKLVRSRIVLNRVAVPCRCLCIALTGGTRETSSEDGASLGHIGDGLADQVLKRLQPSALFGEAFIGLGG